MTIALRGSFGLELWDATENEDASSDSVPKKWSLSTQFNSLTSKVKSVCFSHDGNMFVVATVDAVHVYSEHKREWKELSRFHHPNGNSVKFSPRNTYLVTSETLNVNGSVGAWEANTSTPAATAAAVVPNVYAWLPRTGKCVAKWTLRSAAEHLLWSADDRLCCSLSANHEVVICDASKLGGTPESPCVNFSANLDPYIVVNRIRMPKLISFHLSDTFQHSADKSSPDSGDVQKLNLPSCPLVTFQSGGTKGAPAQARMFSDVAAAAVLTESKAVCMRSLFNAETIQVKWNKARCKPGTGTKALILAETSVDTTGASYYGRQQLCYMDARDGTLSTLIQFCDKPGPIYAFEWAPLSNHFVVVYGFMPSKATLFSAPTPTKECNAVFEFDLSRSGGDSVATASKTAAPFCCNTALFSDDGTVLMLAGFGNLNGGIQMWGRRRQPSDSVQTSGSKRGAKSDDTQWTAFALFHARDSTTAQLTTDGRLLVTGTCAPRLRQDNGFRIWHVSGTLLHEQMCESRQHQQQQPHQQELWQVVVRPIPLAIDSGRLSFDADEVSNVHLAEAAKKSGVKGAGADANRLSEAYVPPALRHGKTAANQQMMGRQRLPPGMAPPLGVINAPSKSAKKKQQQKKGNNGDNSQSDCSAAVVHNGGTIDKKCAMTNGVLSSKEQVVDSSESTDVVNGQSTLSGDNQTKSGKNRAAYLRRTLKAIDVLKAERDSGKQLDIAQLEKIQRRQALEDELSQLKLTV